MTFTNPLFFLVFFPLCMLGFAVFGRFGRKPAIGFLAVMSLVFYAQWSLAYVWLLLGSILFNFAISRLIARTAGRERAQTAWLVAGITGDLVALAYFKYLYTALTFTASLTHQHWQFSAIILPLGISFFTFTQIAYLVDLKQGVAAPESLLSYSFFVTFFPHLIAGPILHHKEIMPQVREERRYRLDSNDVALGLTWFTLGFFKKVIVADRIGEQADGLFKSVHTAGATDAWLGVLVYAMQLYFDFSGYSDMALGLARIFSIRFPLNFNSPFKAQSIIDFWQRWHMTLTQYIMNYLYSPMLFAISRRRTEQGKKSNKKTVATLEGFVGLVAVPTLFTFLIAGIWHGAGLQFLLYGLLHGVYITINHLWRTFVPAASRARRLVDGPVAVVLTFLCVIVAFVLFRAASLHDALSLYAGMLGRHGAGNPFGVRSAGKYVLLLAVVWLMPNTQEILGQAGKEERAWSIFQPTGWSPTVAWCVAATLLFAVTSAFTSSTSSFLYFQF